MPEIELISFKLCPFVQRSVITLLEKGIPFDITYIDLENKPDWFLQISPTGKVPVLRINGKDILFESAVINEYLDEITPPSLHPEDPLEKARNRAWIEFGSTILMTGYRLRMAKDSDTYDSEHANLMQLLQQLEEQLDGKSFFNGNQFSLADAAFAPVFRSIVFLDRHFKTGILDGTPGLKQWADNLLNRPSVRDSVVDDFDELSIQRLKASDSYIVGLLRA
ncbi:glutathione S-transferase [Endozoicomonas montiporae]|uniref:glutathione transferase n=2 Tax=Endozoicomonas montiporae TaxID=1027273 RepID=A0A081MYU5_9GAMM|nr:glutathione S-transferase family protein [Endozoicomonas montiporae]AMO54830.1 glutathione S-transferase [Endozoicomonas montiporae CL-33]KEQ11368.1 glutathione S-transferase [Endozoicomonas montiporae]